MIRSRKESAGFGTGSLACLAAIVLTLTTGCWAPLHHHGIPASSLPAEFRLPRRTAHEPLNLAHLTLPAAGDYLVGPDDVLEITIPGLFENAAANPIRATVMPNGQLNLPLVGAISATGLNLLQVQQAITRAYDTQFLKNPIVHVSLFGRSSVRVLVLGEVTSQGAHSLPKYENDVGHAIAAAQGLTPNAADVIEIHKRGAIGAEQEVAYAELAPPWPNDLGDYQYGSLSEPSPGVIRIPLKGFAADAIDRQLITLEAGDVVVVPRRRSDVFYVVGKLSPTNTLRFSLDESERELGAGFLLPRNREIDVVTAVAMAGYIDPIDSPTTVTVHRVLPDGQPMLINVDLIAARSSPMETILVEPGDIIYLNPDFPWWFRRTFDRVVVDLIAIPYSRLFRLNTR